MNVVIKYLKRYTDSFKNVGFYLMAAFLPMALNLILTPIYSLYMQPEDFAVVSYYSSFVTLFSPFVLFYFNQYYMREFFYRAEDEKEILKAVLFKSLIVGSAILMIIALVILAIYTFIFNKTSEVPFFPYAIIAFLPMFFAGIYRLELVEDKVHRRAKNYFYLCLVYDVLIALFSLLFVVPMRMGGLGQLIGKMLGPLLVFLWLAYRNRNLFKVRFDNSIFKESIKFCFPLVLAAMLGFFSSGYDRVFLERTVELSQLGIYSIGITIGSCLSVFSSAVGDTFCPDIFESLAKKDFRRTAKFVFLEIGIMVIVVFAFILCADILIDLLTVHRYTASAGIAKIASVGTITSCIQYVISNIIMSFKKNSVVLYTKIIGSALCVLMYSVLITYYGTVGAAWGVVFSHLVFAFVSFGLFYISLKRDNTKTAIS